MGLSWSVILKVLARELSPRSSSKPGDAGMFGTIYFLPAWSVTFNYWKLDQYFLPLILPSYS